MSSSTSTIVEILLEIGGLRLVDCVLAFFGMGVPNGTRPVEVS
jgi:ABC-type dipeptide/oligopeptide/nickel transport system permease subunit